MLEAIDIPPSSVAMTAPGTVDLAEVTPCLVLPEDLVLGDVSFLLDWFPLVVAEQGGDF